MQSYTDEQRIDKNLYGPIQTHIDLNRPVKTNIDLSKILELARVLISHSITVVLINASAKSSSFDIKG